MKTVIIVILKFTALLILVCGSLSCAVVPFPVVPEEYQFSDEKIQFIKPGVTLRSEVEEVFGPPHFIRGLNKMVVYGQARTVAGFLVALMGGSGGTGAIEKHYELVVQYNDNDLVTSVDVLEGHQSCTDYGLCIESLYLQEDTGGFIEQEGVLRDIVLLSSGEDDRHAKLFFKKENLCNIYFFNTGVDRFWTIESPELGKTSSVKNGYLNWTSEPGTIPIIGSRVSINFPRESYRVETEIDCVSNSLVFVNLHEKSWSFKPPEISLVTEAEGRIEVQSRQLILH